MPNRLFTFGCSFTNFSWPTWADILGREFDTFENWGVNGAGNPFVLYSLSECHKRNQLGPNDTVIIMWTSIDRDDRWVQGNWRLEGGVFNGQYPFNEHYIKNFADPTGFLIRDLAIISSVKHMLNNIGCKWYFLSMVPFNYANQALDSDVLELYASDLESVRPSIYELVFNNDWYSRPGYVDLSVHSDSYKNQAGPSWPTLQKFLALDFKGVASNIVDEIYQRLSLNKNLIRTDTHPVPAEHLEYLEKALPEICVREETKKWVETVNQQVLSLDPQFANNFRGTWKSAVPKNRF